jgi:hypothetical protein
MQPDSKTRARPIIRANKFFSFKVKILINFNNPNKQLLSPEKPPLCGSQRTLALPWSFVFKDTKSKHQITNKSQIPIFNDLNLAG